MSWDRFDEALHKLNQDAAERRFQETESRIIYDRQLLWQNISDIQTKSLLAVESAKIEASIEKEVQKIKLLREQFVITMMTKKKTDLTTAFNAARLAKAIRSFRGTVGLALYLDSFDSYFNGQNIYYLHGDEKYLFNSLGGVTGKLGFPTSEEAIRRFQSPYGLKGTLWRQYEGGSIFHTREHGYIPTWQIIHAEYIANGGPSGSFGFPIEAYYDTKKQKGRIVFENKNSLQE